MMPKKVFFTEQPVFTGFQQKLNMIPNKVLGSKKSAVLTLIKKYF